MNATTDWPPRFTIDQESILELFTGETFYSSVDASIREAILNSIDAVGRRQATDPSVNPRISVVFDRQSSTVTVTDNGDGIGRDQMVALFSRIGASASRVAAQAAEGQYNAVGEFGIGVLSYFLVCERFQIFTLKPNSESLGLEFSREMLDAKTQAVSLKPRRTEQGTDLILFVDKESVFEQTLERFPYWIRDVEGLTATDNPGGKQIPQGGISREIKPVSVSTPDWIQTAHIGPPKLFDSWDSFDGAAHVDILYRGVFVASISIEKLWAIEGAIHVDPKHFRPKLNREGFVGDRLEAELEPVLRSYHPAVLERAIECVREVLSDEITRSWSLHRWVTIWLAVPRSGPYEEVAKLWDDEFRHRKAFRLLEAGQQNSEVSIRDIEALEGDELYIAPLNLSRANQVTQQAVRVLRNSGHSVIQGVDREPQFLRETSLVGASTGDLLSHFQGLLPRMIHVESVAHDVIRAEAAATVFDHEPKVQLVRLGQDAAAVLPVGDEIWVNIDHEGGKQIVRIICSRNEGHIGLWIGCREHGKEHAQQIANILSKSEGKANKLGPIRRRYLMETVG